jgi:cytochrome P450
MWPAACLGVHLARLQVRIAAAHFFLSFPRATVSMLEGFGDREMDPVSTLVLSPRGGRCLINLDRPVSVDT